MTTEFIRSLMNSKMITPSQILDVLIKNKTDAFDPNDLFEVIECSTDRLAAIDEVFSKVKSINFPGSDQPF